MVDQYDDDDDLVAKKAALHPDVIISAQGR